MTTYYVSTSGNDNSGTGTQANPWKTIQESVKKLVAGDTLLVNAGTYDKFDITDSTCASGSQESPIRVKANGIVYVGKSGIDPWIPHSCIYIKDVSGWEIDGFRIKDQRRAAVGVESNTPMTWIVLKNFIVENVWSADNASQKTNSTFRINVRQASGGYLNKLWIDNNTFINCSPRDIRGKGTEIVTLFGNIENFLVENNRFTDCVSICVDILGANYRNTTFWGQPKNGVVRKNIVENNDLYRNGTVNSAVGGTAAAGGTQETCNGYYNDRGGQNIVWENNVHWSPKTLSSFTSGWETGNSNGLSPADRQIVRNNLSVSGFRAFQAGSGDEDSEQYFDNLRYAHNVGICTTYNGKSALNARNIAGTCSVKNNVWESKVSNGFIMNRQYDNATGWTAEGNLIWAGASNNGKMNWNNSNLTPSTYNTNIENGNAINADPQFVSEGNYNTLVYNDSLWDYKLAVATSGYNNAVELTQVTNNVSNATVIEVDDPYWFFAGIPMPNVTGDPILINGQARNIVAVDVDNNLITIDVPITATAGDPIEYNAPVLSRGLLDTVLTEGGSVVIPDTCPGLIVNGDFDTNDLTSWTTFTNGTVSFSGATGKAVVTITDPGSNTQLYQSNILLNEGVNYELSFDAYTDSGINDFTVAFIQQNLPNANLGLNQQILLTSTPQTFTYTFTATALEANSRLRFYFVASDAGVINIDNVCLKESDNLGTITADFTYEPTTIYEGDTVYFEDLSVATNTITDWDWDFSGEGTSALQNPSFVFNTAGVYNVTLTVTSTDGTDDITIPVTILAAFTEVPPTVTSNKIDNHGTVVVQTNHPSWFGLFNTSNNNLLATALISYNVFTGLGQGIEPCSGNILSFNIDNGNYILEDCDGLEISSGTDARLALYGLAHPILPESGLVNRGEDYWNWYQTQQSIAYGTSVQTWPTLFELQFVKAQGL